jgi:hypothetical protein
MFTGATSVSVFRVSPLPRFTIIKEGLYISIYRSS